MNDPTLPPGCSESDIPGNRPEDLEWDGFVDWLAEWTADNGVSPEALKAQIVNLPYLVEMLERGDVKGALVIAQRWKRER